MSGPKIIDYAAVERQRAEAARRRWRTLVGRADALRQRCSQVGYPDCAVRVSGAVGTSSEDLERRCDDLARAIDDATTALSRRQFADRTKEVAAGLGDLLAALEQREQAGAELGTNQHTEPRRTSTPPPAHVVDYGTKVAKRLASLMSPSPALECAARAVLTESDPARARLLYTDLQGRVTEANKATMVKLERLTEIAELRAQLDGLSDPDPLSALLDHAARSVEGGADAHTEIAQARRAITQQLDEAAATADRVFVREALAESLSEIGYLVDDIDLVTPETLVMRQSVTHGVRATVGDGKLDVRTVRLGPSADRSADRDADEEFCARVPDLLAAMARRGVTAGVTQGGLPGLHTPETVSVKKKSESSDNGDQEKRRAPRTRGAR